MSGDGQKLQFDDDFGRARRADGAIVEFTRGERALLTALAARPNALLSRQQLLDAIAGPGSDSSDRNIDFLVNRVRRKLGDSARSPVYIATQYGEGYRWIAGSTAPTAATRQAVLVVGPLRDTGLSDDDAGRLARFGRRLAAHLDALMATRGRVVFDATCPAPAAFGIVRPRYGLSLDALMLEAGAQCVLTLREFDSVRPLWVRRRPLAVADGETELLGGEILAALLRAEAGEHHEATPDTEPLPVRMYSAVQLLGEAADFRRFEARMRLAVARDPDDPVARSMLATGIHSRLIMSGHDYFRDDDNPPTGLLDEIEDLLLPAVPRLLDNPIHQLAAAKLLYFLDRGHDALAIDMAEAALSESSAFAAAFTTVGQMRGFEGDVDGAMACLEQGFALAPPGSVFHGYILVIWLQMAIATADPGRVAPMVSAMAAFSQPLAEAMEIHFGAYHPDGPSPALRRQVAAMDIAEARAMLRHKHATAARLFKLEAMRANHIGAAYDMLRERFGPEILAADIAADIPSLAARG